MNKTPIVIAVALFIAALIGLFVLVQLSPGGGSDDSQQVSVTSTTTNQGGADNDTPYSNIERITAKHFYNDGTHTFVGELAMPTPCDLLETGATVRESMPEQVTMTFSVINESEVCAQVITPQRFIIEVSASEDAVFDASFMGRPVELNLLEPAPGETPDDFELYIKG